MASENGRSKTEWRPLGIVNCNIERDAIICVLVRDVVDISMELNEIKAVMTLAAEHGISINAESRGYEPALISFE